MNIRITSFQNQTYFHCITCPSSPALHRCLRKEDTGCLSAVPLSHLSLPAAFLLKTAQRNTLYHIGFQYENKIRLLYVLSLRLPRCSVGSHLKVPIPSDFRAKEQTYKASPYICPDFPLTFPIQVLLHGPHPEDHPNA